MNGDGHPDFDLHKGTLHQTAAWYLTNNVPVAAAPGPTVPAGWTLVRAADSNRNGHPDYLLFNSMTGATVIWYMNNNMRTGGTAGPMLPAGWELAAP